MLVGADKDNYKKSLGGGVYLFTRSGSTWREVERIYPDANYLATSDYFGSAVSVHGDTAMISAIYDDDKGSSSGGVYVFIQSGSSWTQVQKLTASDGQATDTFGASISIYADTALIDAHRDNEKDRTGIGNTYTDNGSVYIFIQNGLTWTELKKDNSNLPFKLHGDAVSYDYFGYGVSLYSDTALIDAFGDDDKGSPSGSV